MPVTSSMPLKQTAGPREFIALMAVLMSVTAISIDAMLPALGLIGRDLQVAYPNQVQYIISLIFAGMAIGQLVCGPLSDAWGRKRLLYTSICVYLGGSILCFFATDIDMLLLGRFIQGLGVAGPYVSCISVIRDRHSGRAMARIMSLIMMIFLVVPALAPSLGQGILYMATWHYIFAMYIVYALIVIGWVKFRLPETLPPEKRIPFEMANILYGVKEILGNRTTLIYLFCAGLIFGSFMGYLITCQQVFQDQFKVGDMFAFYFACLAVIMGSASLTNSRIVERVGMRYLCIRSSVCIIAASAVFAGLHFVTDIHLWMYMAYAATLFFCFGLLFGNLNALAMEPMGHIAGMASAIIGCASSVLSISLGTFIGQSYDGSLLPVALGFLCLNIISLGLIVFEDKKFNPERKTI